MHATMAHQWSSKAGHSRNSTEHARARTSTAQTHRITHILRSQTTAKPQPEFLEFPHFLAICLRPMSAGLSNGRVSLLLTLARSV